MNEWAISGWNYLLWNNRCVPYVSLQSHYGYQYDIVELTQESAFALQNIPAWAASSKLHVPHQVSFQTQLTRTSTRIRASRQLTMIKSAWRTLDNNDKEGKTRRWRARRYGMESKEEHKTTNRGLSMDNISRARTETAKKKIAAKLWKVQPGKEHIIHNGHWLRG